MRIRKLSAGRRKTASIPVHLSLILRKILEYLINTRPVRTQITRVPELNKVSTSKEHALETA